jgi:hypothetical protein
MFSFTSYDGSPLTVETATARARFEPLYEATQIKGDGEAHPFLSPEDEFADFDTWDAANLNGTEVKQSEMLAGEYAREALKRGLKIEQELGGYDFTADDTRSRLPADAGYRKGVPMGGNLGAAPDGKAPTFLVAALKDALSGNLDRIQIIKGWVDADGALQERVHNVVWAGDRALDADGRLPDVGNTVDVQNATWTNSIGAGELIGVWEDPDFDPAQRAFYYARVIEIPTPRWTAYEARRFGIEMPPEVPMITTERAYTSPIWYTPKG